MPSPKETVDAARQLAKEARRREKCLDLVEKVDERIDELTEAAEFTLSEWLTVIGILGGTIVAIISTAGALAGVVIVALGGLAEVGVLATYYERVKRAKKKLEKTMDELRRCLAVP